MFVGLHATLTVMPAKSSVAAVGAAAEGLATTGVDAAADGALEAAALGDATVAGLQAARMAALVGTIKPTCRTCRRLSRTSASAFCPVVSSLMTLLSHPSDDPADSPGGGDPVHLSLDVSLR